MLRLGQVFHQPQQAESRRRHRPAQQLAIEPFQLAKQRGAVEVELLCQRVALVSQTIRHGPLHRRLKYPAPTLRPTYDNTLLSTEPERTIGAPTRSVFARREVHQSPQPH